MSVETIAPETPEVEAPLSISEHAATFGPNADKGEPEGETAEERLHHANTQRREKTGEFTQGKRRGKDAVVRINELTGRAKSAEEAAAASKAEAATALAKVTALEAEVQRLRQSGASASTVAKAEAKVEKAEAKLDTSDPEPKEEDFGDDYAKYLTAHARWSARDEMRQERQRQETQAKQAKEKESEEAVIKSFAERVEKARQKYPDYDAVAFGPTKIQAGSPVDLFIMEDDNGEEVLYHLQRNPQELDDILKIPSAVKQVARLALISQRFASSNDSSTSAGTTGSASGRVVVAPPKPPNPVRTEAQRAPSAPKTDGSLSITGHMKAFRPK